MSKQPDIDLSEYTEEELNELAREAQREHRRLYMQEWRKKNPEKSRINCRNSYARKALRERAARAASETKTTN